MRFEENRGQTDGRVKFLSRGQGYTLFLTGEEAVLSLRKPSAVSGAPSANGRSKLETRRPDSVVRMKWLGAQPGRAVGVDPLATKSNYFLGNNPAKWRRNVPNYAKVKYEDVYPGIDLVYYGQDSGSGTQDSGQMPGRAELEFDFVLAPGADPNVIRFVVETEESKIENRKSKMGQSSAPVRTDANGDLVIATEAGEVHFREPVTYQMVDGRRHPISARYALRQIEYRKSKMVSSPAPSPQHPAPSTWSPSSSPFMTKRGPSSSTRC